MVAAILQTPGRFATWTGLDVLADNKVLWHELFEVLCGKKLLTLQPRTMCPVNSRKQSIGPEHGEVVHVELSVAPLSWILNVEFECLLEEGHDAVSTDQVALWCLPGPLLVKGGGQGVEVL